MNRSIKLILCILITMLSLTGKAQDTNGLRGYLNHMFEHIDKTTIPTGFLRDYAVEDEDFDLYNGQVELKPDNQVNISTYGNLLNTICSAYVFNDNMADRLSNRLKASSDSKKEGTLRISYMLYKYARIKANALRDGIIAYQNEQVFHVNKNVSPYETEQVFAACALDEIIWQPDLKIIIPSDLVFTNFKGNNIIISIDYGEGYKIIKVDSPLSVRLEEGENNIKLKVQTNDGGVFVTHSSVYVVPQKMSGQLRSASQNTNYDTHFVAHGSSYKGIQTEADVYIKYGKKHGSLKKPFIIVEGFDPRVDFTMNGQTSEGVWTIDLVLSSRDLRNLLWQQGFDLVYVDWRNSGEYIQANANTLIEVIKKVNLLKSQSGSSEKNVVIGHSMGGVIARYALRTMEVKNSKHDVSSYISYDSPHLGAHIPLGVLYGFHGLLQFIESRGLMKQLILDSANISSIIEIGKSLAYSNSAQQMLVYFVDPAGNFNNQEHYRWQNELNELGFPKGDTGFPIKNLSVSNGCYKTPQISSYFITTDFSAGSELLSTALSFLSLKWKLVAATSIGFALNDIVSGLLTLLPGRTAIDGNFDLYPAKKVGDNITSINLKYKKKFLWLIPITRELFNYNKFFPNVLCYDFFPGSFYGIDRDFQGNIVNSSGGIPLFYDYRFDTNVAPQIQFIPTSSALAFGDGLNSKSDLFFRPPMGDESPFGSNYFVHTQSQSHSFFTRDGIDWIDRNLKTSIIGPRNGFDGAKYSLSEYNGVVKWHSERPEIANISTDGVLSVKGKGHVLITATTCSQDVYSTIIVVGMPRFILNANHVPGGYKVSAKCIDLEFDDGVNSQNTLVFRWGIKYPNSKIRWFESNSHEIMIQSEDSQPSVTIFMQVQDTNGDLGEMVHTSVNSQVIYYSKNQTYYIDSNTNLYKQNMRSYSYKSARLYIEYKPDIPEKYKGREWMPITALVLSPSGNTRKITIRSGGALIKDIIPESEINWIKQNSVDGEVQVYIIAMKNYSGEVIQYMPVKFIYKSI